MFHKSLLQSAASREHLLGGVNDPVLKPKQQIQVAQAEVGIEHCGFGALFGQGDAQVGGEGGFAHATLSGADQDVSGRRG
jgi:hypothetical protein